MSSASKLALLALALSVMSSKGLEAAQQVQDGETQQILKLSDDKPTNSDTKLNADSLIQMVIEKGTTFPGPPTDEDKESARRFMEAVMAGKDSGDL